MRGAEPAGRQCTLRDLTSQWIPTPMLIAITREVSPSLAECELSFVDRAPIDAARANAQHRDYQQVLAALGCDVKVLPAEPAFPDAVFVEDVAIVVDEVAVMTRPGAESRRGEGASVARVLAAYRTLRAIEAPGTLDGGDVLRIGRMVYVGQSARSNAVAIEQLRELLSGYGYTVQAVPTHGCLHLKSAVTQVADDTLLVQSAWIDPTAFAGYRLIEVDPAEEHAANALRIGTGVIYPASFSLTRQRLETAGIEVIAVDLSELQKAEGATTCCSLVFRDND
jgi:dimethylargininase